MPAGTAKNALDPGIDIGCLRHGRTAAQATSAFKRAHNFMKVPESEHMQIQLCAVGAPVPLHRGARVCHEKLEHAVSEVLSEILDVALPNAWRS
eukprot:791442-Alexandrium_andersonii.AAC.1